MVILRTTGQDVPEPRTDGTSDDTWRGIYREDLRSVTQQTRQVGLGASAKDFVLRETNLDEMLCLRRIGQRRDWLGSEPAAFGEQIGEPIVPRLRVAKRRKNAHFTGKSVAFEAVVFVDQIEVRFAMDVRELGTYSEHEILPRFPAASELVIAMRPDFEVDDSAEAFRFAQFPERRSHVGNGTENSDILRQALDVDLVTLSREMTRNRQDADDVSESLTVYETDFHRRNAIVRMFGAQESSSGLRTSSSGLPT